MQKKTTDPLELPPDSTDTLFRDFDALQDAILAMGRKNGSGKTGKLLALVRLFNGFTQAEWGEFAAKHNLEQWVAIDLSRPAPQQQALLNEQLRAALARNGRDSLTGLPGRANFLDSLQLELERQKRQPADLSVASINLDHLTRINEAWGHNAGDTALKCLAEKLLSAKHNYDTAARTNGKEFALLLPGASMQRAKAIVQHLLNEFRLEKFTAEGGKEFSATFSAGIASVCGNNAFGSEQILKTAEKNLCRAKTSGRNQIVATQVSIEDEIRSMVCSDEKHFLFFGKPRD